MTSETPLPAEPLPLQKGFQLYLGPGRYATNPEIGPTPDSFEWSFDFRTLEPASLSLNEASGMVTPPQDASSDDKKWPVGTRRCASIQIHTV